MNEFWQETMQIPEARWIIYGTSLLFAGMIAVYVLMHFRNMAIGKSGDDSSDLVTDFRQMRDEGHLDEDEYSRLKAKLPNQYQPNKSSPEVGGEESKPEQPPQKKYVTLEEAEQLKIQSQSAQSDQELTNQEDEARDSG